jgi:choline dehydrogenase-like flavoprotein
VTASAGALIQIGDVAGQSAVDDSADVVIVGSGVAGATAARVLSEAGVDVILVEEGPHVSAESRRADMWSTFKSSWRDMGFQLAEGRSFIPILQGRCVGGSSAINGAIIHRMPEEIHAIWSNEHGLASALPYDELQRVYDQMDEELSVAPAPEDVLGENNKLMRKGVEALGITGNVIRRSVIDCQGSSRCNQGCPTARKQSMEVTYVPRSIAAGARLYATCQMERVLTENGRAVGVTGRFIGPGKQRGPRFTARAKHAVCIAASAIQTPLILKANGVGRQSGLVGRRFQAHPGTGILAVFEEPVNMWFGATQGYESTHYWDERMKFECVGLPLELGAARLPGFGPQLMREMSEYGHIAMWGVQVRARAHGRVKRGISGRTVVKFDLTNEDVRTLKTGLVRLTQMAFGAGAKAVFPGVHGLPDRIESPDAIEAIDDLPDTPRLFHCIATHLFGTAVMGEDPGGSVVGLDCQAHEMPGLYVLDSSVFPTNLGVNPQHTIAAVAWLTAERLVDTL